MKRRSFIQEFKRQAILLVLNKGLPVQTVSKKLEAILIPSIAGFKSMKNTENMPFMEEGAINSFAEMKLQTSKKRINGLMKKQNSLKSLKPS